MKVIEKAGYRSYKKLEQVLTDKQLLRRIKLSKKTMLKLLSENNWRENAERLVQTESISCQQVLSMAEETLAQISKPPQEGWLRYSYETTIKELFPEDGFPQEPLEYRQGRILLMEILRMFFRDERERNGFSPLLDIEELNLSEEELMDCPAWEEYLSFKAYWDQHYLVEFMRIGKEITPFNTVGHICGVHHVALHVARQLAAAGAPVDLALVSGSAAGHDIGKYGCKGEEIKRIPYLHYYYTDLFLKRLGLPLIAHIASNHSTWDLELENLSVESLILIYADFRVKSSRGEDGEEIVHFYTLAEAFDVILGKLDNVDEVKTIRYKRVYAKLKDFEDYMVSKGVSTDLDSGQISQPEEKDTALLSPEEVIDRFKYLAVEHNISLMNKFNNEAAFGNLIEAARSDKQWKNVRAYINILDEYSTHMTQKQKLMTLNFLYELLTHREGDIRRQAAALMGDIVINYDEKYHKELPKGVTLEEHGSFQLWQKTLGRIIFPDHKVTDQHKRWIGYTLKVILLSALENSREEDRRQYLDTFLAFYQNPHVDDSAVFVLLDSMLDIPLELCTRADKEMLLTFAHQVSFRDMVEIKIGALRFVKYMTETGCQGWERDLCAAVAQGTTCEEHALAFAFLQYKIRKNTGLLDEKLYEYREFLEQEARLTSDIFLENLKVDTPWVIKAVNIEFLLDEVKRGRSTEVLHVATHLSNLIKVSERVTVRHIAGEGLLAVVPMLPLDQRNELVVELTRGLEIGEYQFSKYIPRYLGALALYLHPNELDELLGSFRKLLENTNEKVVSVTLDTIGEIIKRFPEYLNRFPQPHAEYEQRKMAMLGMLLRGLANYNSAVSQEAFRVMGQHIFGSPLLTLERKYSVFRRIYKKMLTLVVDQKEEELTFFTNAAALNHIYRFLSDYILEKGGFSLPQREKIAFFPGTFDPFSLSHKGIVTSIRDMGFEVYLALDEFSWSKKTQPRMIRKKIITMSVADEGGVYIFPDDEPINIANPRDLKKLRELLPDKELYIVVGSDVIINASSYKAQPSEHSIHTFNHVVFRRESAVEGEEKGDDLSEAYKNISGKVVELTLPVHLEDISSTRIRENIDYNRDISNLIDPIAQNYIYNNSLYLREPQYKGIMQTKLLQFESLAHRGSGMIKDLAEEIRGRGHNFYRLKDYLDRPEVRTAAVRDGGMGNQVRAFTATKEITTSDLYEEFQDAELAAYLREKATGRILIIGGIYFAHDTQIRNVIQLITTETLSQALQEDMTYAIYHPVVGEDRNEEILSVLERQGFREIVLNGRQTGIYEVDMKSPVAVFQNMDTVLKDPFNKSERILETMDQAHGRLQKILTDMYPGNLVLSFNSGVMHHKIINMVTEINGVPSEPLKVRQLGPYMCVPFGKILRGMVVPNTVTKAIHTEKKFNPDIKGFRIEEYPRYSPIPNQVKTIKSFDRQVILVDDLLHKGYRMKELDPVLKENNVEVAKLVIGVLSGRGKDLMTIQGRKVDSAYFIPNLKNWFVESSLYPFIGGDGIKREMENQASLQASVNLILPYVAPGFMPGISKRAIYQFSMTCLENAYKIFLDLEQEYQNEFERKLTLQRLSEAVISPRVPDLGSYMNYDMNLAPSGYLINGIERLIRLESVIV
ncbi:MAG: hypothetical protein HFE75_02925 [Firmicutes bacterium]|nr:hypothetical protein [Bacillota bacterium]NBI63359.1 hypothetical protein [Clostridiales bacterium]